LKLKTNKKNYYKMEEKGLFLKIRDKFNLEEELYCPPHCFPHKPPFTQPIERERCHYHSSILRMLHHRPFCYLICSNYKKMIETYRTSREKNASI